MIARDLRPCDALRSWDAIATLYGTTYSGGTSGQGTVFTMTPAGKETVLYGFAGPGDGASPQGALT